MLIAVTHDDLPVLLVIGDFVGAPQLTKATSTNLKIVKN